MNKTALFNLHCEAGAKMVPFAGWEMPIHYGSQLNEHNFVRQDAGVFDVSHMVTLDLNGEACEPYLRYVLANDVAKLSGGKALYTCMLNESGGVIDDLIVYKLSSTFYRLVLNAGTRDKDLAWLTKQAKSFQVSLHVRDDLSMLAVQGPNAQAKVQAVLVDHKAVLQSLKPFYATQCNDYFVANTGYTGERGYEVILPTEKVEAFWQALIKEGVKPCGLGARDTLRLEAGLNLYGQDMDETITPLESNLAWTVAFDPADRDFIGRKALETQREKGVSRVLVGLILVGKGVLRHNQKVIINGVGEGVITSGSFSPTLGKGIALALVPPSDATQCEVDIRGRRVAAEIVKPPFVRRGRPVCHPERSRGTS